MPRAPKPTPQDPCCDRYRPELDHFKVYDVDANQRSTKAKFRGQFNRTAISTHLMGVDFFANPVSKNGEGLRDRNAHLAWYRARPEGFATHLLQNGRNIWTVQELLGHSSVKATMTYTHALNRSGVAMKSPLDVLPKSQWPAATRAGGRRSER